MLSFAFYFLVVFSGFYTVGLGLSFVYLTTSIASIVAFTALCDNRKVVPEKYFFLGGLSFFVGFFFFCVNVFLGAKVGDSLNLSMSPMLFFLTVIVGHFVGSFVINKSIRHYLYFSIVLLIIECVIRLSNPSYDYIDLLYERYGGVEDYLFYAYKINSLMYQDSNFVGIQSVILFSFLCAINLYFKKVNRLLFLLVFLIGLATLSRASIISLIVVYLLMEVKRRPRVFGFFVFFLFTLCFSFLFGYLGADNSFNSKIQILSTFFSHLSSLRVFDFLFGFGVGSSSEVLGIGAHNILVVYFLESGLIFSAIIMLLWVGFCRYVPGAWLMVIGVLINGFSLTSYAIPYFYTSIGLLYLMSINEKVWCRRLHQIE